MLADSGESGSVGRGLGSGFSVFSCVLSLDSLAAVIDDFFAVGYHGEFTHIDPTIGEVQPTRYDMEMDLQALATSPSRISYPL